MGTVILPASGTVYVDTNSVVYAVEKVAPFDGILAPLWQRAAQGAVRVITSELTLLEVLVRPVREQKVELETAFRQFLLASKELHPIPIDLAVLEAAVRIRASSNLRTPDALHAATAHEADAATFVTNDPALRRVAGLAVVLLSDFLEEGA